jgi:hypothetical protein
MLHLIYDSIHQPSFFTDWKLRISNLLLNASRVDFEFEFHLFVCFSESQFLCLIKQVHRIWMSNAFYFIFFFKSKSSLFKVKSIIRAQWIPIVSIYIIQFARPKFFNCQRFNDKRNNEISSTSLTLLKLGIPLSLLKRTLLYYDSLC